MKWGTILNPLVLAVLVLGAAPDAGAIDVGWMQPGVRVWYFGGVDTGGVTSSDAEEAYLFNTVAGNIATVVHHSAVSHWETAKPVETKPYPLNDKGPCWIHPQVLQIVTEGDSWMGWEIAKVRRIDYTYATFPPTCSR